MKRERQSYQDRVFGVYIKAAIFRSSPLQVFLGKDILKICIKFTVEHTCRSKISINLQSNFTQDTNCTYIRLSEDVLIIFWTSYVCSIYALYPRITIESRILYGQYIPVYKTNYVTYSRFQLTFTCSK